MEDSPNRFECPKLRRHWWRFINFKFDQEAGWVKFVRELKLEGLKQAFKPENLIGTIVFWISVFLGLIGLTSVLVVYQVQDNYENPVSVYQIAIDKAPGQIPGNAFTVCNVNHLRNSKVLEVLNCLEVARNDGHCILDGKVWTPSQLLELILHMDHRCNIDKSFSKRTSKNFPKSGNDFTSLNLKAWVKEFNVTMTKSDTFVNKIQPFLEKEAIQSCEDLIPECMNAGDDKPHRCKARIFPIETNVGRCCVGHFMPQELLLTNPGNVLTEQVLRRHNISEIEVWNDYNIVADLRNDKPIVAGDNTTGTDYEVPYRQYMAGRRGGMSLVLNPEVEELYCASHDGPGVLFAFHPLDEIPDMRNIGRFLKPGREASVAIVASVRLAEDSNLAYVAQDKLGCYMPNALELERFKNYTKGNCISECIAKLVEDKCKCLMSDMPRSNSSHPVLCGPLQIECVEKIRARLYTKGPENVCPICKDRCNGPRYKIGDATSLKTQTTYQMWNDSAKWSNKTLIIFHFFLDDQPISTKVLRRVNTFGNILGSIGGIVGFTLDISFPRILQMIYAILVALIGIIMGWIATIHLQIRGKIQDSGLPELLPTRFIQVRPRAEVPDEPPLPEDPLRPKVNYRRVTPAAMANVMPTSTN